MAESTEPEPVNKVTLPSDPEFQKLKQQTAAERAKDRRYTRWGFWISMVFGVVGLIYGYLGYEASKQYPALTYAVHPIKTELQRPDFDDQFKFFHRGKPVESNTVTAVQVAIWNEGTKSIRATDMLERAVLTMPPGVRILSAKIKTASRDVCRFRLHDDSEGDMAQGILGLSWHVLEPNDGAVVQLIYAGAADQQPRLKGVVEGQRAVIEIPYQKPERASSAVRTNDWTVGLLRGFLPLITGVFVGLGTIHLMNQWDHVRRKRFGGRFGLTSMVFIPTVILILYVMIYKWTLDAGTSRTPFGW